MRIEDFKDWLAGAEREEEAEKEGEARHDGAGGCGYHHYTSGGLMFRLLL